MPHFSITHHPDKIRRNPAGQLTYRYQFGRTTAMFTKTGPDTYRGELLNQAAADVHLGCMTGAEIIEQLELWRQPN